MPDYHDSGTAKEEKHGQALIVDNNADDCAKVVDDLRRAGHEAVVVASVREARQALAAQPFDLLLLELKLPDGPSRS